MKNNRLLWFVTLTLLVALMIVMEFTGIGYIGAPVEITLMCIPVIIATLSLGLLGGEIAALFFALTSAYTALVKPVGFAVIFADYPAIMYTTIFAARLLIPVAVWGVQKLTAKWKKKSLSVGLASLAGSLANTVFFLGLMFLLGWDIIAQGLSPEAPLSMGGVALFLGGIVVGNGIFEAVAAVVLCTAIVTALQKAKLIPIYWRKDVTGN